MTTTLPMLMFFLHIFAIKMKNQNLDTKKIKNYYLSEFLNES